MRLYTLFLCLGIMGAATGGRQTRYSEKCMKKKEELKACKAQAWENYSEAVTQGDDGTKPDFMARKACNYLTESIECTNMMAGDCHTKEEVEEDKDMQLKTALKQIKDYVDTWDSEKCPVSRSAADAVTSTFFVFLCLLFTIIF